MGLQDRDWYWQDRARKEREVDNPRGFRGRRSATDRDAGLAAAGPRRAATVSWHIAAAVVVVVVSLLWMAATQWRAEARAAQRARAAQQAAARAETDALQARLAAAEAQTRRRAGAEREDLLRSRTSAARLAAQAESRRADAAETERREGAWERYCRKRPSCDTAATVECADDFICPRCAKTPMAP